MALAADQFKEMMPPLLRTPPQDIRLIAGRTFPGAAEEILGWQSGTLSFVPRENPGPNQSQRVKAIIARPDPNVADDLNAKEQISSGNEKSRAHFGGRRDPTDAKVRSHPVS
jgi:hypothetical protein